MNLDETPLKSFSVGAFLSASPANPDNVSLQSFIFLLRFLTFIMHKTIAQCFSCVQRVFALHSANSMSFNKEEEKTIMIIVINNNNLGRAFWEQLNKTCVVLQYYCVVN